MNNNPANLRYKKEQELNREELAWCAGYFDGEGCFYLSHLKNEAHSLVFGASLKQVELETLEKFHRVVTVGSIKGPYKTATGQIYRWAVYGFEKTQFLACVMWPWLGTVKKEQWKSALIKERVDRLTYVLEELQKFGYNVDEFKPKSKG